MAYTSTINLSGWDIQKSAGGQQRQYFEGPRLDDLSLSFQTIGQPIPVIYGSMRVIGQVIQALPLAEKSQVATETEVTSEPGDYNWLSFGFDGWASGPSQTTSITYTTSYSYFGTWAVSLGVDGLAESGRLLPTQIKFDGNTVWRNVDGQIQAAEGVRFRFWRGTEDQVADGRLVAANEALDNETPAYRHLISMVFDTNALELYGNRIPAVQVDLKRTSGASWSATYATTFDTTYPSQARSAVDWANNRAFGFTSTQMHVYSTLTGAEMYRLNYTRKGGEPVNFHVSGKAYIPWLRLIAGVGSSGAQFGSYKNCYLLDPATAEVVAVSAEFGLGAEAGVNDFKHVVPVKVPRAGGGFKTFIFCLETTINSELAVFEVDGTSLALVYEADITAGLAHSSAQGWVLAAGPETTGSAKVYCGTYDTNTANPGYVLELTVTADGVVSVAEVAALTGAGSNHIHLLYYDAPRDQLVVFQNATPDNVVALDCTTWAENWRVSGGAYTDFYQGSFGSVFIDRHVYIGSNVAYYTDLETGAQSNDGGALAAAGYSAGAANHEKFWNEQAGSGFAIGGGGRPARLSSFNYAGTRTSLRTILEGLAIDAGFASADIDFSVVTDEVDGLIVSETIAVNAILADVARVWGYEITDYDKVRLIKPGVDGGFAVDFTAGADDLLDVSGPGGRQALVRSRLEDEALPRIYDLNYISEDQDYTFTVYRAQIPKYPAGQVYSDNVASVRVPVVITPSEAATLAHKALNRIWASRDVLQFRLPLAKYLYLAPGDRGTVSDGSRSYTVKITELSADPAAGVLDVRAVSFQSQESVTVTGDAGQVHFSNSFAASPASLAYLVDAPLIADGHDAGGEGLMTYYGINSAFGQDGWRGAQLQYSDETVAANWQAMRSSANDALLGLTTAALGDVPSPWVVDRGNSLVIRLQSGLSSDLTTISDDVLTSGDHANWLLVGRAGRWELIGYGTVTDNAAGTITLTNLIRGWRGSEVNTGNHAAGDYVLKAELSRLVDRIEPVALLGQQRWLRSVGLGEAPANAVVSRVTVTGTAELPFAPVHLEARLDGTDLDLAWTRRTRLMGGFVEWSEAVPLGETAEAYEVEVMNGASVVRTITGLSSPAATYSSADMTTDWGAPLGLGDQITFRVYQVSSLVGRGRRAEATITI